MNDERKRMHSKTKITRERVDIDRDSVFAVRPLRNVSCRDINAGTGSTNSFF